MEKLSSSLRKLLSPIEQSRSSNDQIYRSIKVITITGLIILGIVLDLGGLCRSPAVLFRSHCIFTHQAGPAMTASDSDIGNILDRLLSSMAYRVPKAASLLGGPF